MILIKYARKIFGEKINALLASLVLPATNVLLAPTTLLVTTTLLESSLNLAVRITFSCRRTLVVKFFTLRKCNQQLNAVMLVKVDLKRNQRQAFLAKLSVKIVNLPAVK